MRRLGAAAVLAVCMVTFAGQAAADPSQTLAISGVTVSEGDVSATFTVTLTAGTEPSDPSATVDFTTETGSAVPVDDYSTTSGTLTVPAGGSETITVPIANDARHEGTEAFTVKLSNPSNGTVLGSDTATGTINDDDPAPTLAIAGPATVDEVAGTARYNVTMTGQSASTVRVDFATAPGSASAGTDFTQTSGFREWAPGVTGSQPIDVPILHDTLDEANETFSVNLSGESGAEVTSRSVLTTIIDNDALPSATINDIAVLEGNDPSTVNAVFTVTLNAASGREVRIPWATAPGTATEPEDYQPGSGTVVIAPGEPTGTITVVVKGDNVFESNEQFSVVLVDPTNATLADNRGAGTITNDDTAANPTVAPASVTEGNAGTTDLVFQVTLPGPRPQTTFNYRTVAGSATSSDYTEVGGAQLVFPAGPSATTLPVTIKVNGDTRDENNESFTLQLLNPTSGAIVASATGTIVNDDNNSKLSINDTSADEPTSGTATMKFTITLAPASDRAVSANWGTANGTAASDSDYTSSSGSVSFAPGETTKDVTVAVLGDTIGEENETVLVGITGSGAGVSDAQGIGTIIDKNAPPSLSIDDLLTREGETATFTITLAGNTLRTVTVVAKTIEGTAKEGTEFHARRSVLTFAPGEKSKTFQVVGIDDTISEGIETYFVGLEDATNATVTKSRGTATIDVSDPVAKVANKPVPPTTKPPAAKPTLLPKMLLGPRSVMVNAGVARMLVTCAKNSPIACSGSVSFERVAKPKLVFGTRKFTVKRGQKGYVRIFLTARALKLLAQRRTLQARAVVVVKTSAKNLTVTPGVITLKQGKPVPKPKAGSTKIVIDP